LRHDKSQIGAANVIRKSLEGADEGFSAVAYQLTGSNAGDLSGETVISYRGTDNFSTDIHNGWLFGTGFTRGTQLSHAQQFFEDVTGIDPFDKRSIHGPTNPILTGHSLGGGLAGHISALTGDLAVVFDNEPFGAASVMETLREISTRGSFTLTDALEILNGTVQLPIGMSLPDASNVEFIYADGEILEVVRNLAGTGPATLSPAIRADLSTLFEGFGFLNPFLTTAVIEALTEAAFEVDVSLDNPRVLTPYISGAITLHDPRYLLILQYGEESFGTDGDWTIVFDKCHCTLINQKPA